MTYQTITLTEAEGTATITLNRSEVMNALSTLMRAELLDAVKRAEKTARVIVLTGSGRAFCWPGSGGSRQDRPDRSGAHPARRI